MRDASEIRALYRILSRRRVRGRAGCVRITLYTVILKMSRTPSRMLRRLSVMQQVSRRTSSTASSKTSPSSVPPDDWDSAKPYSEIPRPRPLPIIGNVHRFLPGIGEFSNLSSTELVAVLHKTYGPVTVLGGMFGRPDAVFIRDAEEVEKVFRNEGTWPVRKGGASLEYYFRKVRKDFLVSLIVSQGKEWQEFRTAINQVMMQPRNTKQYVEPIDGVSQEFIDKMKTIRDDKGQMPDDFFDEISKWSLESITYVALDTRLGLLRDADPNSDGAKMIECARIVFQAMYELDIRPSPWKYVSTPTYRKFVKAMDYFTEVASKHVNTAVERLQKVSGSAELENHHYSVLEQLLLRCKEPSMAVSMALDMLLAGVDTTSTVSATVMYQVTAHPDKQRILQQELDRVIPDPSKPLTKEQFEEMKYLRACVKEALRVSPILIGNGRATGRDMVIGGYRVPRGTDTVMNMKQLCSDERYFPRPAEFLPERWLTGAAGDETLKTKNPFAFLPFGFGPRMCVGKRFAELEIESLIAKVFRNFTLEWNLPPPKTEFRLLLTYASPLKFTVKDRV